MTTTIADVLRQEVDTTLQQAEKHREALRQRVATACDRIQRQQALARAESLSPSFRVEFLRRARAIQKSRDTLLQTLKRFATVLHTNDLRRELCDLPNVVVVLRAVQDALRVEEKLAYWRQPLPRREKWRAVCTVVRNNTRHENASSHLTEGTEQEQEWLQQLEEALERLLFSSNLNGAEEDEETAESSTSWIAIPCFCTIAHYCHHAELSVIPPAPAVKVNNSHNNNNVSSREGFIEAQLSVVSETERDVSGDGAITQTVLHAAAAHFDRLIRQLDEENEEKDVGKDDDQEEAIESALEEARLRVSIELAARASACRYAVESLATGEDGILFDGVAKVTEGVPFTAPVSTLVLPPLEQLFFCIAYTVGAAILRDERNERSATSIMTPNITIDDNNINESGWRGALESWILQERFIDTNKDNNLGAIVGPRLLQYLLEYVFSPTPCDIQREGALALVRPETARRWLTFAFGDTHDKDSAIEAMMNSYWK